MFPPLNGLDNQEWSENSLQAFCHLLILLPVKVVILGSNPIDWYSEFSSIQPSQPTDNPAKHLSCMEICQITWLSVRSSANQDRECHVEWWQSPQSDDNHDKMMTITLSDHCYQFMVRRRSGTRRLLGKLIRENFRVWLNPPSSYKKQGRNNLEIN